MEKLMLAEDLYIAPVMTWWNAQNAWSTVRPPVDPLHRFDRDRFYHVMGGEDEREGGALLYFGLSQPLAINKAERDYPPSVSFLNQAKESSTSWIDIEKPFWWDVPVWLASGKVDSIGIANNHMNRSGMLENEAWGRPRDSTRLPAPLGNGYWTQEIYYKILNAGLRVPPSAGSASGVLPNPVGYNRVYVHCEGGCSWDDWWKGLALGRSFVSNGPLILCKAGGQIPGHVFRSPQGTKLVLPLHMEVWSKDKLRAVEVIHNGKTEKVIPVDTDRGALDLGTITFEKSGWFLMRVFTDQTNTFRFASTAPYYVEIGAATNSISRESCNFFLNWVRERKGRVKVQDPVKLAETIKIFETSERFWQKRMEQANSD
jgi:hypothetical protein